MAKKSLSSERLVLSPPKKRPGVVSKNKHSNHKKSKNYVKSYRGQGR